MFVKHHSPEESAAHERVRRLSYGCQKFLSGHGRDDLGQVFSQLAEYSRQVGASRDDYGNGAFMQSFEAQIAKLLGFSSSAFMPSGTMAQLIALRIAADQRANPRVGFHATSHLEVNEFHGYAHLHHLKHTLIGDKNKVMLAEDLEKLTDPLAAIIVELPYRRLGGIAPSWNELQLFKEIERAKKIHLHLDGARLWEVQPFYGKSFADICAGFDSAYVSFYKGIGAIAGSMLLGTDDFISQARVWQRRQGGNLVDLSPYVVSAKMNFDARIDKFPRYFERTLSLASAIREQTPALTLRPTLPQSSMLHVFVNKSAHELASARDQIAQTDKFWLFNHAFETEIPGWSFFEVAIGDAALALSNAEIISALSKLKR